MDIIQIEATERSPEVEFDFAANRFALRGESYPENVNEFFGDMLGRFKEHLAQLSGAEIGFEFDLIYFNSSSAKILMTIFDLLDECAAAGNSVAIQWRHADDDDNMEELGEEFAEDLEHVSFQLVSYSDE